MINEREFDDFGGTVAEIWKYDTNLLTDGSTVDDLSLLLSLEDDNDERIQKELNDIKEKYGIKKRG